MSALPDSSDAPARAPEPPPSIPEPHTPPSRLTLWVIVALVLAAGSTAWLLRSRAKSNTPAGAGLRTGKAIRGPLARTLRVTGSISARTYSTVAAPMMTGVESDRGLVLLSLPPNGSMVREGQLLAEI